jgi:adenosine kinase
MSILISGSVAFDTIIQTVGDFRSQDASANHDLHLSLFSPLIRKEYGGTAANIAYSLSLLGNQPHIIASVGEDSGDYILRLQEMGIYTELIQSVPGSYCAQAYIIRDEWNGQINTFHAGAMSASGELTHGNIDFEHVIVAPDSKAGMIRRVNECTKGWVFTIFDPGQAMGIFTGEELRDMVTKSDISVMNEPERIQFQTMTGIDFVDISLAHGHSAIITLAEKGAEIRSSWWVVTIPAIYVNTIIDATGCGDAFRSGLLYGLAEWWNLDKCVKLWNILGGIKIKYMGGQNHTLNREDINIIGEREFGEKFFD